MSDSRGIDLVFNYDRYQMPAEDSVKIVELPEMTKSGRYPVPMRLGRPSRRLNPNSFSDHYPITKLRIEN